MNYLITSIVLLFTLACSAGDVAPPADKTKFKIFLLIGQSNMAGRGKVEEQDQTPGARRLTVAISLHRILGATRLAVETGALGA